MANHRLQMRKFGAIVQNCYIVADLEQACLRLHDMLGIGPFIVGGKNSVLGDHYYRGEPAPPVHFRGAFVQSGDIVIELIQLISSTPSAFHDMFGVGAEGLHHAAMFCGDYEVERDALVIAGYPVASEFTVSFGARICYVDTRPVFGHMLELYPPHPQIHEMYRRTREASENWDGRDLIVCW